MVGPINPQWNGCSEELSFLSGFACLCNFQCSWRFMQPYLGPFSAILGLEVPFLG